MCNNKCMYGLLFSFLKLDRRQNRCFGKEELNISAFMATPKTMLHKPYVKKRLV